MGALILGFVLDLGIGDPHNPYHPVRFIGKLGSFLEGIFRRIFKNSLKIGGFLTWILTVGITYYITLKITYIFDDINFYLGIIVKGILIYFCIATKGLIVEGLKVIDALRQDNIEESRKRLSYIVGRDTENLDKEAIIKAVIETVAENMSDGIIAPLIFIGLGGAPLGMVYKAVNTCDSMFGYKNEKYKDFGFFPAKLDDVFNFIPARVTGILIIIGAFLLGLDYKESYKIYKRDKRNHTSPNSAHPEAAVAGALNIKLGGANYYFGKKVIKPTIGDEKKKIDIDDLDKTNEILVIVSSMGFIMAMIINILIGGIH